MSSQNHAWMGVALWCCVSINSRNRSSKQCVTGKTCMVGAHYLPSVQIWRLFLVIPSPGFRCRNQGEFRREPIVTWIDWRLFFRHISEYKLLNQGFPFWFHIISLHFVPTAPIGKKSALLHVVSWCQAGDKYDLNGKRDGQDYVYWKCRSKSTLINLKPPGVERWT